MSSETSIKSDEPAAGGGSLRPVRTGIWGRQLTRYPNNLPRGFYLAIVVVTTIVLYYELYIQGAVATSLLNHYHMSFTYFVYISVVGGAAGALASLAAGLADRWGRANLVTYGLLITGLLMAFAVPNAPSKTSYLLLFTLVSVVEGVILVATPALVRDFSPQLGRASAMGFWTLGPVIGSLVVTEVSNHTLKGNDWQPQFHYAGYTALAVFVLAFIGLRELSPQLRDQLMVSLRDRTLIEARARGIDPEKELQHHWRSMFKLDVVGSAFAISVFLLLYYTFVGFLVVYFATNFGYSPKRANGLANWYWIADATALVLTGLLSDFLKVRKPFMVIGALISAVGTAAFAVKAHDPSTSYHTFAWIFVVTAVGGGMAYAPWMASFTETVEKRNPAATATGLAVWGLVLRSVVAVSLIVLAAIMTATTILVEKGPVVAPLAAKYKAEVATGQTLDPTTSATLNKFGAKADGATLQKALGEIQKGLHVSQPDALNRLVALGKVPKADLAYLTVQGPKVQKAQKDSPDQWRIWWWVSFAAQIFFIPFIFVMSGRWSPRKAREDAAEHQQLVERELQELSAGATA